MQTYLKEEGFQSDRIVNNTMIQPRTIVNIADNSGAKIGRIFKVLGATRKRYAEVGEVVVLSVQKAEPRKAIKKKDVLHAVVVRQTKPIRRKDGSYVRFDENAVVIIEKDKKEPIAGRIFGPIPREVGEAGFKTIATKAAEIV
jgi:large subunit ribosomal protein L14